MANKDYVNHPSHYTDGKIEVIDYIEDKKLNYHLGNVVKYISRAGKKVGNDPIQDLKKALWYLNREIDRREKERTSAFEEEYTQVFYSEEELEESRSCKS